MPPSSDDSSFYLPGGTLSGEAPSYVERQSDRELLQRLRRGEFCYVLTSRQMGKSSLMVRTQRRLREEGVTAAAVDLTSLGQNLAPDQWYDGLLVRVGSQLRLEDELDDFWLNHERLGPAQRFFTALSQVVLPRVPVLLVLFIDELDALRSLPFPTDEFLAGIRQCYSHRAQDERWRRLSFCLLGVSLPGDLVRDPARAPFPLGTWIELEDFNRQQAECLAGHLHPDNAWKDQILDRILYWTGGHPYLTQHTCRAVAAATSTRPDHPTGIHDWVDQTVQTLFLDPAARDSDNNLVFVRERLLQTSRRQPQLLQLYKRILNRQSVPAAPEDPLLRELKMTGLICFHDGAALVRNRIYCQVFDRAWVDRQARQIQETWRRSLAVLQFQDLSPHPRDPDWAAAFTEEINAAIWHDLQRISLASLPPAHPSPTGDQLYPASASSLGVEYLLHGALRLDEHRLRVFAKLLRGSTAEVLWSGRFQSSGPGGDDQPAIAREIVQSLQDHWQDSELNLVNEQPLPATETIRLALKGRYHITRFTGDALDRAADFLDQAVRSEPGCAQAHAWSAELLAARLNFGQGPPSAILPRLQTHARQAVQADDLQADSHAAWALALWLSHEPWPKVRPHLDRALVLDPVCLAANQLHAQCLAAQGHFEKAITAAERALQVDTFSLKANLTLGFTYLYAGDFHNASNVAWRMLDIALGFYGTHWLLGLSYAGLAQTEEALAQLGHAAKLADHPPILASLGWMQARAGLHREAQQLLDHLLQQAATGHYVPALCFARIHHSLGQADAAQVAIHDAIEQKDPAALLLKVDPHLVLPL